MHTVHCTHYKIPKTFPHYHTSPLTITYQDQTLKIWEGDKTISNYTFDKPTSCLSIHPCEGEVYVGASTGEVFVVDTATKQTSVLSTGSSVCLFTLFVNITVYEYFFS